MARISKSALSAVPSLEVSSEYGAGARWLRPSGLLRWRPIVIVSATLVLGCASGLVWLLPVDGLVITSSALLVFLALLLAYQSASFAKLVSPAFIFVVIYVVLVYLGNALFYLTSHESNPLLIALALLAFGLGAFVAGSRWSSQRVGPLLPEARKAMPGPHFKVATLLGGLTILIVWIDLQGVGASSLLAPGFQQHYVALTAAAPPYSIFVMFFLPLAMSLLTLVQACHRDSKRLLLLAFGLAVLAISLTAYLGERYPDFYLAIAWFIVLRQFGNRFVRRSLVILLPSTLFLLAVFVYVATARSVGVYDFQSQGPVGVILSVVIDRVIYEQAHVVAVILNTFPNWHPYFGGYTFETQLVRLPWSGEPSFQFATWLYPQLHLGIVGTSGYAPPTVFGEFYANFGPLATTILMFLTGVAIALFERGARPLANRGPLFLIGYALAATCLSVSTASLYTTARLLLDTAVLLGLLFALSAPFAHPDRQRRGNLIAGARS